MMNFENWSMITNHNFWYCIVSVCVIIVETLTEVPTIIPDPEPSWLWTCSSTQPTVHQVPSRCTLNSPPAVRGHTTSADFKSDESTLKIYFPDLISVDKENFS